ncbi:transporter substrate-binding domain-containing protein [Streptomyces sp. NBC_00654]|uniref:caspase, EACC1-associated type n=1 Tax=Streptomyces sp. NBC_00654 TaxID=2975799 RepID=UPI00224EBA8A|nr:transporter substrate-binding domain-containing protein [Streptomyces sp. NBC_00654]MCX4969862.1 transporter substrate-binding domain-containing protein [Streptomyces sp. NBC_00654]
MSDAWLPDGPASRAVLIGAGSYTDPELPGIPAVRANLDELYRRLTDPETGLLLPEHCEVVRDPRAEIAVGAALARAAREADDLLLVYYCGHGVFDDGGLLHFALTETQTEHVGFSALPVDLMRRYVGGARARSRVLLLDCCFSGQAVSAMAPASSVALGQLDLTGTYTLTSTTATAPSHAPPGAAHTSFTQALLNALDAPEPLTLDEVHQSIDRELVGLGLKRPQRRSMGEANRLTLVRRRAEPEPEVEPAVEPPEPDPEPPGPDPGPDAEAAPGAGPPGVPRRRKRAGVMAAVGLAVLVSSGIGFAAWNATDRDTVLDKGTVRVGVVSDLPASDPEASRSGFPGFGMDTVEYLLEGEGSDASPAYAALTRRSRTVSLEANAVEMVAGLAITPEAMRRFDFVGPYAKTTDGVLVRADEVYPYKKGSDLDGKVVCVSDATRPSSSGLSDEVRWIVQPDIAECVDRLRRGKVDAVAMDRLSLSGLEVRFKGELVVAPDLRYGPQKLYGVALPKGHRKDCERLRDVMKEYVNSRAQRSSRSENLPTASWQDIAQAQPTWDEVEELSCKDSV